MKDSEGYKMGPAGRKNIKKTHRLFLYDLNIYKPSREKLKTINETIVQARLDTRPAKEWESAYSSEKIWWKEKD